VVGPGVSSDGDGLLAEYGGGREEPSPRKRARQIGDLIVRSLRRESVRAAVHHDDAIIAVTFEYSGRPCVIGLVQPSENEPPAGEDAVREVRDIARGPCVVVVSVSGFEGQGALDTAGTDGGTILWDRAHLEAVLCGLVPLTDLLDASINAAVFRQSPYEPLARLLEEDPDDDTPAPLMATPDQVQPPWEIAEPSAGIDAHVALTGEGPWARPSGIAALGPGRLAMVTRVGLIELDAARGTASWLTRLPGCVNEPLVRPDGSLLAVCGRGVARIAEDGIEAVAGEFDGSPRLLAGPGGEPWVLSGQGSEIPGDGTLALTRLGERPGDQHRYGLECAGDVRAAAWLGGLRFFLAAPGGAAVIDLARSTRVTEDDWIESPWADPSQLAVSDPGTVVTAAIEADALGPGARVTLYRTDLRARRTEPAAELALNGADGLCTDSEGTGYLLGDVSGRPESADGPFSYSSYGSTYSSAGTRAWPVLMRLPGLRPPEARTQVPAQMVLPDTSLSRARWDTVRLAARGQEKDYELDVRPIDRGGQAEVYGARHRQTGLRVAFKRLRRRAPHTVARMRREIEAAQALGGNPHVMPVLDYGPRYDWFVMPFAEESAATAQPSLRDTGELRSLVTAMCEGLRHAHEIGWLHRDIKPANLLRLGGTWTVADWGLVRRPLGTTTEPGRTRMGAAFGTIGFGAPELSANPHHVGPQADIFGIGQIIGWATTGRMPQANTPLIPPDGPWRQVVRTATQRDPARRPATVDALLRLIAEELDYKRPDISEISWRLSEAAWDGDESAAAELFALAARYPDDRRLYAETLPAMTHGSVVAAVDAGRHDTLEILGAMGDRARSAAFGSGSGSDSGSGPASDADTEQSERIITWLHWIQARAGEAKDLELLEEATRAVLAWDQEWDRDRPRRQIASWLGLLQGDQAAAVARALREAPGSAKHFGDVLDDGQTDERIQRAVRAALNITPDAGFPASALTQVDSGLPTAAHTYVDRQPEPYALPPEPGGFVGRVEELAGLARLLETGRLATVTGPAGAGKTRLARRGAAAAADRFRDGACLVDLSGVTDPARFPAAIAAALGLGEIEPQEVITYLLHQELLIVLDSCDRLLGPCADFASCVMRDTAGVAVIATSGQPLGVTGERCLEIAPLPVPSSPVPAPAPSSASEPSSGSEQSPASEPDSAAPDAAVPAPSRAPSVPEQRENLYSADVDTLYVQCTPTEQALWQRLSVFSGLFDIDAAEAVCGDPDLDPGGGVMGGVTGLAAKSVVIVHQSPRGTRYRLADGCRELGAEKLAASGQEDRFRRRHFDCYQAMSRRFAAQFLSRDGAAMLRQLRANYSDIRAALEYASSDGTADPAQGAGAASLAVALSDFWRADGQLHEGRYWLGRTVESCPYPTRELAQALIVRGHLSATAGEAHQGVADIREGIRIAAALGDQPVVAMGNLHLTQALTFAEYYEEAAAAGTEAYHLLRRLGDDPGGLRLQAELASLETLAGSPQQAVRRCEKSLRTSSAASGWVRGYLYAAMAFAQFHQPGLEADCEASTCEALRVYQEFGDRTGIAYALEMLGWLAARAGRHMRTAWLLGAADSLWESAGSRLGNVPAMEELHAIAETSARGALSQHRFADVSAMGSDSPLNEVIAFAIGDISLKVS